VRSDPQPEITGSAGQFEPLRLTVVGAEGKEDTGLWAEYVGARVKVNKFEHRPVL
jgi:hypothetical protein